MSKFNVDKLVNLVLSKKQRFYFENPFINSDRKIFRFIKPILSFFLSRY